MKVIFHLDLDSYFVSAERTVDERLLNKPIVITTASRRSIVSAVSYEAKVKGVKTAMPFYQAQELVPDIIAIRPNFALYTTLSSKLFEYLSNKYTTNIEVASIDECYLDATPLISKDNPPKFLARKIQREIMQDLKLPISIGISNNKFVAKMSTQINKPFGITVTKPGEFLKVFSNWDVQKYHGIGKASAQKLKDIGINTIGELSISKPENLRKIFGKNAESIIDKANGIGNDIIETSMNDLKSIGNSITFQDNDKNSRVEILEILSKLCKKVSIRSINRNLVGTVISLGIKKRGGHEVRLQSKRTTLNIPIQDYETIYRNATILFDELWDGDTIKHIGIGLTKLKNIFESTYQTTIFDKEKKLNKVDDLINKINKKHNKQVVYSGKNQIKMNNKKTNQSRYIESDRILKHYDK